jgi:hypothetical protein
VEEPRDSATFRMAVFALGLSLIISIIGIAVIISFGQESTSGSSERHVVRNSGAKVHVGSHVHGGSHVTTSSTEESHPPHVPENLWLAVAGLFGVLVGLLIPNPRMKVVPKKQTDTRTWIQRLRAQDFLGLVAFLIIGGFIFIFALEACFGTTKADAALVAAVAALFGILVPSPARYDSV